MMLNSDPWDRIFYPHLTPMQDSYKHQENLKDVFHTAEKVIYIMYSRSTSFGQKFGHFSFFCKLMDIFQENIYIFRKVTSVPTFLA